MADKVKTVKQLKLVAQFADDDDRTISLDDPKSTLTGAQIKAVSGSALIGDKAAAAFTKWKSAHILEQTVVYLDLNS